MLLFILKGEQSNMSCPQHEGRKEQREEECNLVSACECVTKTDEQFRSVL